MWRSTDGIAGPTQPWTRWLTSPSPMEERSNYYVARKRKILRGYDKACARARPFLVAVTGEEEADAIAAEARAALEFEECAVQKFYDAQALPELQRYCNFFDGTYSRLMNMGVDATQTLGLGCDTCTLAYARGRETPIPDSLRGILPGT